MPNTVLTSCRCSHDTIVAAAILHCRDEPLLSFYSHDTVVVSPTWLLFPKMPAAVAQVPTVLPDDDPARCSLTEQCRCYP
ncbi:hypothetical protein NL676_018226 [Syzygium grande]|nr:hypothetical protein NL676_018226 [Syzygium grande]